MATRDRAAHPDKEHWERVLAELQRAGRKVPYEIVRARDGRHFIVPVTRSIEQVVGQEGAHPKRWCDVRFRQKGWERGGTFILDQRAPESDIPYVGRFSYNPFNQEFLMDRLASRHADTIESFGKSRFNEYQRGIYVKESKVLLIRPYYNPVDGKGKYDPYQEFDPAQNEIVTETTLRMLRRNGLPRGLKVVRDANNKIIREYTHAV